jgi:hypothetical protein
MYYIIIQYYIKCLCCWCTWFPIKTRKQELGIILPSAKIDFGNSGIGLLSESPKIIIRSCLGNEVIGWLKVFPSPRVSSFGGRLLISWLNKEPYSPKLWFCTNTRTLMHWEEEIGYGVPVDCAFDEFPPQYVSPIYLYVPLILSPFYPILNVSSNRTQTR